MTYLQQDPPDLDQLAELIEWAIAVYEMLPFLVWIIILFGAMSAWQWFKRWRRERSTSGSDRQRRRGQADRTDDRYQPGGVDPDAYVEPSEYDEIRTPNEVDRSIVATIRRLVRLTFSSGRDGD